MEFKLTVLGTRGSVPVEGKIFERYGGATSCYKIQAGNEEIYLDAGSGIFSSKPSKDKRITILLSHMHLDHLVGLPFFLALTEKGRSIEIFADKREGLMPKEAIDRLISPPFWPLKIEDYPADVKFLLLPKKLFIGNVEVEMTDSTHPNGSTIYKLTYQGKSIVYATDFEHTPEGCEALAKFSAGCDILLYDAQYTAEQYDRCRGYGHSTPELGLKVADRGTDAELDDMEKIFSARREGVSFAKIGDEVFL